MTAIPPALSQPHSIEALHARFLAILPRIETHAAISFRHVRCSQRREEAIAETVAVAWKWFVRLAQKGTDATAFASTLASLAALHVRIGRLLCGTESRMDALSPRAQARHGFTTGSLPDGSSLEGNVFDEALHDNTQTPVPEQVVFRCDFPAWRKTRTQRDRRIIDDLMVGERTLHVARKYGVSPARVSMLRGEFRQDWDRYTADPTSD